MEHSWSSPVASRCAGSSVPSRAHFSSRYGLGYTARKRSASARLQVSRKAGSVQSMQVSGIYLEITETSSA